jgi:hypothetical protein
MLEAENGRTAAGKALLDHAGLRDWVDNREASGRRERAIEAMVLWWVVVRKVVRQCFKRGSISKVREPKRDIYVPPKATCKERLMIG